MRDIYICVSTKKTLFILDYIGGLCYIFQSKDCFQRKLGFDIIETKLQFL